jgi:hypothetical protein
MWPRLRLYVVNAFIAAILLVVVLDTLPQSPSAVRIAIAPVVARLGINQGAWNLFAPDPDRVNTRLRAEVTYRDGERRDWRGPEWRDVSAWEKWVGHRRREWFDHIALQNASPAWEPWCRHLARTQRQDLEKADRGAEVRVIYQEAAIPPAESRPWPSIREPAKFDDGWVLTIEKLE